MRKLIKNLSTLALVATFAFVAVTTVNLEFSNLSNLEVTQTIAFANDGGGDGGGDSGGYYYNYSCTNGATNYPYCNDNVCTNGATNFPSCNNNVCTNGATNYPTCNNQCVVQAPQTQTLACPSGQTGSITQTRTSSCPTTTGSLVWSAWTTTANSCQSQVILPTGTISANPSTITIGQSSTLTWSSTNATYCVLGSGETVGTSGSRVVSPAVTTSYSITCYNSFGASTTTYTTVTVNPLPTCTNGATNYPACNNNVCTNGATNYPNCNICPAGQTIINGHCSNIVLPTASIYANPSVITVGQSSTLTWSSTNATYCVLGSGETVGPSGSRVVSPSVTTSYSVTCYNAYGQSNVATTQIVVNPGTCSNGATNYPSCNNNVCTNGATNYPYCNNNVCANGATNYPSCNNNVCTNGATNYPNCNICPAGQTLINNVCTNYVANVTANIYANPSSVTLGNPSTLTWSSSNASYCRLNGGQFNNYQVSTSGSITVTPNTYTTYTVTCYNASGMSANDSTYVSVNQVQNLPTVSIYPSSYSITAGGQVTLNWSSTNASYCTATPWPYSGSKSVSGSETVTLNNTTTFTITCFNSQGQSAQAQTTVTVNPVNYVYCNGVQYPAGTVCPNTNYVGVSTTGANPLETTANIFGYVNPNGTNATMWFEYGTNPNSLYNRTNSQNAYSAGPFSANLSGLACGTTYYYRAVAQNAQGTRYGQTLSFVTSACQQTAVTSGTVITRPATAVGTNYGQLNGSYIYGTNNSSCSAYFQYGTNYNLVNSTNPQSLFNSYTTNSFSQAVYGLSPNTTYYYRAVSNCADGIKYGSIMSFRTGSTYVKPAKPVYVNKPITVVVKSPVICNCDSTTNSNTTNGGATVATTYMDLVVERLEAGATIGGNANYRITYKNVASTTLQDVAIRVIFPEELTIVSSDRGDYTVGGNTLTLSIPQLISLEEGRISVNTKVSDKGVSGNQVVVNAYANYTVPSIVRNGAMFKDEVTAYVLSVLTTGGVTNNGTVTSGNNSLFGGNFFEWLIMLVLVLGFILAMVYLFTASKRRNQN